MTNRPISTLLVANRAEIASRVFRTARSLGIRTVAVFSEADAGMPFVTEADLAVALPGNAPADTYLRADLILDAARRTGSDAIHPGYGFLSENASFAQAVIDAGITWVGPPPAAMDAMGSKLQAKRRMRSSGVPVLADATVSADATDDDLLGAAGRVGYPLLVKASAGGGGRGMRVVRTSDDLVSAVHGAAREAASAFGDGTVFLERYVEHGRHVEIQVFADTYGACVALHERECSIQRRHQKIIEECPSPAVSPALRTRMGDAAVTAARAVDYVGAGTVEFLLDADGEFAFLEMNTRLQVEHPVTEMVTGLDLVALQLSVAEGGHLPAEALTPALVGHAIEARLYAEDPADGYRPSIGPLYAFEVPERSGLRVDAGFATGSAVSPYYDSMLAKVIAWAPTRAAAARSLAAALDQCIVAGVTTNRQQLVDVLRHDAFLAGVTTTTFLDEHGMTGAHGSTPQDDVARRLALAASALAQQAERRRAAAVLVGVPSGWRNNPSQPQVASFVLADTRHDVRYRFDRTGHLVTLEVDGTPVAASVISVDSHVVVMRSDGVQYRFEVRHLSEAVSVVGAGHHLVLSVVPRFEVPVEPGLEGSLVAPMPGSIVRVMVEPGSRVAAGDVLVVIEAMKMEHGVRSPIDGTVADVLVGAGDQVDAGQPLLVITGDDHADDGTPTA